MKLFWWISGILIILVIGFFVTTTIYMDQYLEEYIGQKLEDEAVEIRGKRYQIKAEKISTDLLSGNLKLEKVSIKPSTLISDTLYEPVIVFLEAEALIIKGFEFSSLYFESRIEVEKIELKAPTVKVYFRNIDGMNARDTISKHSDFSTPEIYIEKLRILNGSVSFYTISNLDTSGILSMESFTSTYEHFKLDSFSPVNEYPLSYKKAFLTGKGLKTKMSFYQDFFVDEFSWNTEDSIFRLKTVQVKPKINPITFTAGLEYQDDWFAVDIDKIELQPFSPIQYLENQKFKIRKMKITHPKTIFYRDITLPRRDAHKLLPSSEINKIPWNAHIDQVEVKNGDILYREKFSAKKDPLEVSLTEMNTKLGPIQSQGQTGFTWQAEAKLIGEIPFTTTVKFQIQEGRETFSAKGELHNIDFRKLNKLITKLAPVKFDEGKISDLSFSFQADADTASGFMDLEYENLKLFVTKDRRGKTRSRGLLTFTTNSLVRTSNKINKGNYKRGVIFTKRDRRKSFFNYFWRSVESGLISSFANTNYDQRRRKKELQN
jgi:Domain of Unknown Function (DUF748)